jgi:hypothetical protein
MAGHKPERVCSPVCVTMVCRFWGRDVSMPDIAANAYDELCDVYGNWSLNALAASLLRLKAFVDRGESIRYLEDQIVGGRPVITSIAYGKGELRDAPVPGSKGHLVVVTGFTAQGDPIVRDPGARGDDPWLTYNRAEFARAWLGHGGVVYRIEPEAA